ncbi:hypothetical protein L484_023666 [Morus notabilis]|uniref:Uncharacterized protein n=1 Tax=Morus notabilis TaxID=981085 RepID=W9RPQ5_9ROSA|nr:hypothetical protein L484_023666 [Morus notabilis]
MAPLYDAYALYSRVCYTGKLIFPLSSKPRFNICLSGVLTGLVDTSGLLRREVYLRVGLQLLLIRWLFSRMKRLGDTCKYGWHFSGGQGKEEVEAEAELRNEANAGLWWETRSMPG